MVNTRAWLLLWLPAAGLLAASCGSDSSPLAGGTGGAGGESTGQAGEPHGAGTFSEGGSNSSGEAGAATAAGGMLDLAGAPPVHSGGAGSGGEASQGGASEGGVPGAGGLPPLVAEASCLEHDDCLAVCNANGWPGAHCFGSAARFCSCNSENGGPTCTKGTTEGCPTGTACRSSQQCMPYGDGTQGDPCDNGDECAPGFICVGFGNPLPSGSSTACAQFCAVQDAPTGCDCSPAGYCLGGMGLSDSSCEYPSGTPCTQSVFGGDGRVVKITGGIEATNVYVVSLVAQGEQNVDLEVCGSSDDCQGDHVCESSGVGSSESCLLQAADDELYVHVLNRDSTTATVSVDVESDTMTEYKLSYTQSISSLVADGHMRLLVTGLTPSTSYEFHVATANSRDINLTVSNDLHGQQELCDEDLIGAAASCTVAVTQASVWVVLTDTSGIGDGYTFKVTAQ